MLLDDTVLFTLNDVLQHVDTAAAIQVYRQLRGYEPRPSEWTTNPPLGTWKLDPVFGTFEVLVLADPHALEISKEDDEFTRQLNRSASYRQLFHSGQMPPASTVVRHVRGHLYAENECHVIAARDTKMPLIPVWFSETTPTGRPRWKAHRLGSVYAQTAALYGWDHVINEH